jgi:hypothetical protein
LGLSGCGGDAKPTGPSPNGAPLIGAVLVSPSGVGLQSATTFAFTAQGVSDPDGDALTYSWVSSDAATSVSNTLAASHVYDRSGTFEMRLTVTDSKGLSASASVAVRVGNVSATWDLTCNNRTVPTFPTQFVASVTQIGSALTGTITGNGRSQTFPAPPSVFAANVVGDPRRVTFGVEGLQNVWDDSDFYFHLTADDSLTAMSGSSQYCGSVAASRR